MGIGLDWEILVSSYNIRLEANVLSVEWEENIKNFSCTMMNCTNYYYFCFWRRHLFLVFFLWVNKYGRNNFYKTCSALKNINCRNFFFKFLPCIFFFLSLSLHIAMTNDYFPVMLFCSLGIFTVLFQQTHSKKNSMKHWHLKVLKNNIIFKVDTKLYKTAVVDLVYF